MLSNSISGWCTKLKPTCSTSHEGHNGMLSPLEQWPGTCGDKFARLNEDGLYPGSVCFLAALSSDMPAAFVQIWHVGWQ